MIPGSYVCVDIPGFVGAEIRHFTHSDVDHCFVLLDDKGTILEAQPNKQLGHTGAHLNNIREYGNLPMYISKDHIDVPPDTLMGMAETFVGIPYSFLDIAALGIILTTHWHPWPLDPIVTRLGHMICSQLVAHFGVLFGMKGWLCGQSCDQYVTPGMLNARGTRPL